MQELFNKSEVICPEWLSSHPVEDEWLESNYSDENGTHRWVLDEITRYLVMSFDGEACHIEGYDHSHENVIYEEVITEEYVLTS